MNNSYEVEIKTLLGSRENAESLKTKMATQDPTLQALGSHSQLNHYFQGGDLQKLEANLGELIEPAKKEQFAEICKNAKSFSLRTRLADGKLFFIIKAAVDDTTSSNGTARLEFESKIENQTLDQLDALILKSGFEYQAKWSRDREEYKFKNINVTIDKNAGYGYLAEFERIESDLANVDQTKIELRKLLAELGLEELDAARLERMFDYYNKNWHDYYGTDKVFTIN